MCLLLLEVETMKARLTERVVKAAEPDPARKTFIFDEDCRGFALSIAPSGSKRFVLDYTLSGRQRRLTIGAWPDWSVQAAREEAQRLRREIDGGADPLGQRDELRAAATVEDLAKFYRENHLPRLAARNASDQVSMLDKLVLPVWGRRAVIDITSEDVERLLDRVAEGRARPAKKPADAKRRKPLQPAKPTPVRANRCGEMLRKMFGLAVEKKMRPDNPAAKFYRRLEVAKERFLTTEEISRLAKVLDAEPDRRGADILRMCMLTGARLGEVRCARFDQFNLDLGIWTKQAADTKQRRVHRLPISQDTAALVRSRRAAVGAGCDWLFPGDAEGKDQPVVDLRRFWARVQKDAGLPGVRIHDLRHTFASLLVSGGASLELIGKLLGHTQAKTTARYAHLAEAPLRDGVEAVGMMLRPHLAVVGGGRQSA